MDEESYVVSSLVVECEKDRIDRAREGLEAIGGVEVHEINGCKLVVTIEAETSAASADIAKSFSSIPGVRDYSLVYVNFEEDKSIDWNGR